VKKRYCKDYLEYCHPKKLSWRILDEEKLLKKDLSGYPEYLQKVRYRLVPYVW
jgi:protein-S-isoprenylcysteine O-methyltransferase Ste14